MPSLLVPFRIRRPVRPGGPRRPPLRPPRGRRAQATAAITSASPIPSRQGCPGDGQRRALLPAQGALWSPSSTCGTPYGPQRSAGTTGRTARRRRPHRGGEVCGPGVADHRDPRPGQDPRQLVQVGGPAEVEGVVSGDFRGQVPLRPAAGHHDAVPLGTSAASARAARAGLQARAGTAAPGWSTTYGPGPVRCAVSGGGETRSVPSSPGGSAKPASWARSSAPGLVAVGQPVVAQVEEGSRVVLAVGRRPADAGEFQQQRGRERALVVRDEHQGAVEPAGGQGVQQFAGRPARHRRRFDPHPGGVATPAPRPHRGGVLPPGRRAARTAGRCARSRPPRPGRRVRPAARRRRCPGGRRASGERKKSSRASRRPVGGVGAQRQPYAWSRSAGVSPAASVSSGRVTGVGTSTPRAPAARAASTSAPMSPMTTVHARTPSRSQAASTRPGAGLRQPQPSSGPCGQTAQSANGPSRASTRCRTAST